MHSTQGYATQPNYGPPLNASTQSVRPPVTLLNAINSAESLNKRLDEIGSRLANIAQSIGGPFPVGGEKNAAPIPTSAIHRLSDAIDASHRQVNEIESSLAAMQRALGE